MSTQIGRVVLRAMTACVLFRHVCTQEPEVLYPSFTVRLVFHKRWKKDRKNFLLFEAGADVNVLSPPGSVKCCDQHNIYGQCMLESEATDFK